jgi:RNA polymerase sigma factor (sigma-70 family)
VESSTLSHRAHLGLSTPAPLLRLQGDDRLVALTRRGNQSAYEALVARYQARLLAFCRHMLGSREDAEDVLQEVFAAAFNALLADERAINVRPWLYRIARNRCLNHLRRIRAVGVDSMDVHLAEHGTTTAEKAHDREEFRQLIRDVQRLPESQRTALLLREIDALSYEQIAEAMETTVPSVKSLLVRARVGLAEAAEARLLSCEQVRQELGEVAEGLKRVSPPARRHLRECQRCASFRKQLRETNRALAAVFPLGPLLLIKKFLIAQAGATAGASGATAAAGGATVAGSAAAGSALSTGLSALATKTAAGLAAAAIVTAGAVQVEHATQPRHQPRPLATGAAPVPAPVAAPVAIASVAQPARPPASHRAAPPAERDEAHGSKATTEDAAAAPEPAGGVEAPPEPAEPAPPVQHEYASTTLPESGSDSSSSGGAVAPEEQSGAAATTSAPGAARPGHPGYPGSAQAGSGHPGVGQPGSGQAGYGQPGSAGSGSGQPGSGQAGGGEPGPGEPGYTEPAGDGAQPPPAAEPPPAPGTDPAPGGEPAPAPDPAP